MLMVYIFVEQVHLDYLEAGADIIITASYQVLSFFLSYNVHVLCTGEA